MRIFLKLFFIFYFVNSTSNANEQLYYRIGFFDYKHETGGLMFNIKKVTDNTFNIFNFGELTQIYEFTSIIDNQNLFSKGESKKERQEYSIYLSSGLQKVMSLTDNFSLTVIAADNCNPQLCYRFNGCADINIKGESQQIDSLSIITCNKKNILNINDCPYELANSTLDKINNLYEIDENEVPSDIQVSIKNEDMGIVMLRIVEFIGQDKLEDIDADTIYFIISTMNQLNIDPIRNKILLKVLPLKV